MIFGGGYGRWGGAISGVSLDKELSARFLFIVHCCFLCHWRSIKKVVSYFRKVSM